MNDRRSLGDEMYAFVRYVAIASALYVVQATLVVMPLSGIGSPGLGSVITFLILTAMATIVLATISSIIPFVVMAVIANRLGIKTVVYYVLAGCLMAALTALEVSLSFSRGVSFDNMLPRWERFYAEFGSLLLPVVAATLAYWQFDVRKSVSLQSSETV